MAFVKGVSGNPSGRPRGIGKAAQIKNLMEQQADLLVAKAVELALSGDTTALKLCIDRIVPSLKPQSKTVSLPITIDESSNLHQVGLQLLKAALNGMVNIEDAQHLATLLEGQRRLFETTELEKRISLLEGGHES